MTDPATLRAPHAASPRNRDGGTGAAAQVPDAASSVVSIRHLSKNFGPIAALKDVSLDIAPGQVLGICGENGAGKSTLVKILTGVYRPDDGTILVDGKPVSIATPRQAQELGIAHRVAGAESLS